MTDWDRLRPEQQEMMSPEFWAGLTEEERQARLRYPLRDISDEAMQAYVPEQSDGGC